MGDGFRFGDLYGSYSVNDDFNGLGFEIGFIDVPNMDEDKIAKTFSIAIKISNWIFAIGWIFSEEDT